MDCMLILSKGFLILTVIGGRGFRSKGELVRNSVNCLLIIIGLVVLIIGDKKTMMFGTSGYGIVDHSYSKRIETGSNLIFIFMYYKKCVLGYCLRYKSIKKFTR